MSCTSWGRQRLQSYAFTSPVHYLPLPRWQPFLSLRALLPVGETFAPYDLLHIPHNYSPVFCPERTLVTLHDAMFAVCPDRRLHRPSDAALSFDLARRCRAVITCSKSARQDIVEIGQVAPDKVHVIYWGYSQTFRPAEDLSRVQAELQQLFGLVHPYFLCVACDVGRKSSPSVLREFLKLAAQGCTHDLVMVWRNPPENVWSALGLYVASLNQF